MTANAGGVLDSARRARLIHRSAEDGTDQQSVRVPGSANDVLLSRVAGDVKEELCQIVAFPTRRRSRERFAQVVLRDLVAANRSVRRLYLVPSGLVDDPSVRQQVERDEKWGCTSAVLPVKPAAEIPMDDVWLIDASAVVRSDPSRVEGADWVVSTREADITETRDFWIKLWDKRQSPANAVVPQYPPDLTARLLTSAPKIREVASVLCHGGHVGVDPDACEWYHGVWQYLRLFNMVSSPSWHSAFYHDQLLQRIHAEGSRRVLISGSADYSTLAFVLAAAREGRADNCDEGGVEIVPHVLDRCPTALAACTWYAKEVNAQVATHQVDITDADAAFGELVGPGGPLFDVIIADAFLTRFDRADAAKVIEVWSALLRPGGTIITTVRLHPRNVDPSDDDESGDVAVGGDPIANFQMRLRRLAEAWRSVLHIDIDDLCDSAREYALRMTSNDMGDRDEIVKSFEQHNFDIEGKDIEEVGGELVRTAYLRLVARKRG